jgi:hypothetical protein
MVNDNIDIDLSGVKEILDEPLANKISSGIVVFFVVFMCINTIDLFSNNDNIRSVLDGDTSWEVSFDEKNVTLSETTIIADGDSEIISFEIEPSLIEDGYRVGLFRVSITYGETSGIPADPPDSVHASILETDLNAEWQDDNNTLSGSSNDGSQIDLTLRSYPNYDGQLRNVSGYNEIQVLEYWIMDGYGIGTLDIEISVDTQALPFTNDNDEQVTITVEVVTFKAIAEN